MRNLLPAISIARLARPLIVIISSDPMFTGPQKDEFINRRISVEMVIEERLKVVSLGEEQERIPVERLFEQICDLVLLASIRLDTRYGDQQGWFAL